MRDCLYTSNIRSLARRLGVIKLVTMPRRLRQTRLEDQFKRQPVSQVRVRLGSVDVDAMVSSAGEYARIISTQNDNHLIAALERYATRERAVFWDIGANIGLYSIAMAKLLKDGGGKVIAFEPEPRSALRLKQNLALNQIDNVFLEPVALGAEDGMASLSVNEAAHAGSHSLVAHAEPSNQTVAITVTTGSTLVREHSISQPTFSKIDVEGFEARVIEGMIDEIKNPHFEAILCEVHFSLLEKSGQHDIPRWIVSTLIECGLINIVWMDSSHLLATRHSAAA
ncbi:conserved hypothetical protein [uncultured Defluviicoccus sp.]|uniref:Methyltransferase FkbM domain-containing protein n=1 Tax=metagenome TaxID=256318 RepID=A0A380THP0_9ZZZZ|nr:conserved hypothetical protein [uncultured Defluviicoccus sp.]